MAMRSVYQDGSDSECDSGYDSADNSPLGFRDVFFTRCHLRHINAQLQQLSPEGKYPPRRGSGVEVLIY